MDSNQIVIEGIGKLRDKARERISDAERLLQHAQQAYVAAHNEFKLWTAALERLTQQDEPGEEAIPAAPQATPAIVAEIPAGAPFSHLTEPVNRTKLVLDTLRVHPEGLTPDALWSQVATSVDKPYFYSITKRLRDRKYIELRDDGKYYGLTGHGEMSRNGKEASAEEKAS